MFTAIFTKLWSMIQIIGASITEGKAARARIYMSGIQTKN